MQTMKRNNNNNNNEDKINSTSSTAIAENDTHSISSSSMSSAANPGELTMLMEALQVENEDVIPLTHSQSIENLKGYTTTSSSTTTPSPATMTKNDNDNNVIAEVYYGTNTWKEEEIDAYSKYGIIRKALLLPNKFETNGKLIKGLNPRDFKNGTTIKPRRASLPITKSDFFSGLSKLQGPQKSHYIWYGGVGGCLNGWPSLRCFELLAVEERRGGMTNIIGSQTMQLLASTSSSGDSLLWKKVWESVSNSNDDGEEPSDIVQEKLLYRVTLRASPWTSFAWAQDNPGFVFWYEPHHARFTYGTDLTTKLSQTDTCTKVHMVSHRYAVGERRESVRDHMTYHSFCVLEWEHGQYCSVVELAYLNGIGGYQGKCNFYDDRDAKVPNKLYAAYPPELIQPWFSDRAEIRAYDVKARNFEEFKTFVQKYSEAGESQRFVDPQFTFSHPARLTMRTKAQMARYLINYITRDDDYEQLKRNCQTFAADLCAFVAGKKSVSPYSPLVSTVRQVQESGHNKIHHFMYDSYSYQKQNQADDNKQYLMRQAFLANAAK